MLTVVLIALTSTGALGMGQWYVGMRDGDYAWAFGFGILGCGAISCETIIVLALLNLL